MNEEEEKKHTRLVLAGVAMHALIMSNYKYPDLDDYAMKAFILADCMLKRSEFDSPKI